MMKATGKTDKRSSQSASKPKAPQKKKQGGMGAPYFGDKGAPHKKGDRTVRGDQRDMGLSAPKGPKAKTVQRMRAAKGK
jgi:hypothetical protein